MMENIFSEGEGVVKKNPQRWGKAARRKAISEVGQWRVFQASDLGPPFSPGRWHRG
jgi:hypothetical protein